MRRIVTIFLFSTCICLHASAQRIVNFDDNWRFMLGDDSLAKNPGYNDTKWRKLDLPHDWSIEGNFSEKNTTTQAEGGLPAGIGWYRKTFTLAYDTKLQKEVFINFDGVYHNSEVWINGHYLGKRPNGYVSFSYYLTPYLNFNAKNTITVRVDNSDQPNSRWYSGSGIYRNVWLSYEFPVHLKKWGTFITTPTVTDKAATVHISTSVENAPEPIPLEITILDEARNIVAKDTSSIKGSADRELIIKNPELWSVDHPHLYSVIVQLLAGGKTLYSETYKIGIRSFQFDAQKGFFLNGKSMKIKGVCLHHDEGALGAAVNTRAIERQLQLLKDMGCNAIRTSHNPPAPEFLDLCDKMGLLVLDEAFDMWAKKKSKHDYHEDWAQWHVRDLQDQILRDRNHPSVFMWSVGNEIREQFDTTGISITKELVGIVKNIDNTRSVTSALSEADPKKNFIYQSGALDVIGFNYHPEAWPDFPKNYPGQKFIATETTSAYETRGFYEQPTDSTRHWPTSAKAPFKGNPEFAITAYDNVVAYWGATHEDTWKVIKKYDFLSGLFVWTGFDYIGEPTPYPWPARSSYFGIIDLAGFPKDIYYMYQSEWTNKPVLHLLPHWNWKPGQIIDVWAYYSQADEVELFLNGRSLGVKRKTGDSLHVNWKVKYEPGTLKAISRRNGKIVLIKEIHTAGPAAKVVMVADRRVIKADGKDLSYFTVKITDKDGNIVPDADNLVYFKITGPGKIAGVDNGSQSDLESFKANCRKAFHGMCLVIVQSDKKPGSINIEASSVGLASAKSLAKSE